MEDLKHIRQIRMAGKGTIGVFRRGSKFSNIYARGCNEKNDPGQKLGQ